MDGACVAGVVTGVAGAPELHAASAVEATNRKAAGTRREREELGS